MKITNKILYLPPHISTHWNNIATIHTKGDILIINLIDSKGVEIPGLSPAIIETIFNMHAAFLEESSQSGMHYVGSHVKSSVVPFSPTTPGSNLVPNMDLPFRLAIGPLEEMGASVFQHNAAQGGIPEIPLEILMKIVAVTRIVAPDEMRAFPKPEPHCNCVHCQIGRTLHQQAPIEAKAVTPEPIMQKASEETVSDAELSFQQWQIEQTGDRLFNVINKLDQQEKYSVFLGTPVGCTCGKHGCEHIIAVLKS